MATTVKGRILVLTNVDWAKMNPTVFAGQSDPTKPLMFIENAKRHDLPSTFREAFGVSYFQYRRALRGIGERCLRSVANMRLSIGFGDFDEWFDDEEDEFIFPIDDDDFYHPDLARTLSFANDDTIVLLWDLVQVGFLDDGPVPKYLRQPLPTLLPNNWAIRKSFLRKHFDRETCRNFLADHGQGQLMMVKHLGISYESIPKGPMEVYAPLAAAGVVLLSDCYSVYLVHPGSLTYFYKLTARGSPLDLYRRLDLTRPLPSDDCIRWAEPYLREAERVIPRLRGEVA